MVRKIKQDFFKEWSPEMGYILGYITADGCVIKRKNRQDSYILNITSKDRSHLVRIKKILNFSHPLSKKYNSRGMGCSQIQICNRDICKDLITLGILPRKTYHLEPIKVPQKYFSDFVRGFFDGDGTVYIYKVNGTLQIKADFIGYSSSFVKDLNKQLCERLNIPYKNIHIGIPDGKNRKLTRYSTCFYIDDCEKLAEFMYGDNPTLYLPRKRQIFDEWKSIKRRRYIKQNYPSKIGLRLNEKVLI